MRTLTLAPEDIEAAAGIMKSGGLVAVPTETVYGLAANGLSEDAVRRIYEVKGRPEVKPLSLMVSGACDIERYCDDVPTAAYTLAEKFWPGPLTIVLKSRPNVPAIVRAGGDTVGLRCPAHPVTLELIRECGLPLAAPSANLSGEPSPKTAADALGALDGSIDAVLDGGPCTLGVESTIIDLSAKPYRILRHGALSELEVMGALTSMNLRDFSIAGGASREQQEAGARVGAGDAPVTLIGITGGSGGGKTTALDVLRSMGALTIDCDRLYHELLESDDALLSELEGAFPAAFADGALDRKKLGAVVFANPDALARLNGITHKYVGAEMDRRLRDFAANEGAVAVIDAIALIESGFDSRCDAVVAVLAPEEVRIERLMKREGLTREYAKLRVSAQKPDSYYRENCGYILENSGDLEDFTGRAVELFSELVK